MPDEAPVLPKIEERCNELLMVRASDHSSMELLQHAISLELMCERAALELCTGSKHALARLLLETATHLQPLVLTHTAMLLHRLVGREGVIDLLRPLSKEGWTLEECSCGEDTCPGYIIMTEEFKEQIGDSLEAIVNLAVDAILDAVIRTRRPPRGMNN